MKQRLLRNTPDIVADWADPEIMSEDAFGRLFYGICDLAVFVQRQSGPRGRRFAFACYT